MTAEAGSQISGTGTIGGNLAVASLLTPGNSIGTLTVGGNLTLTAGSTLQVEVNDAAQADLLRVTGTVSLGGATLDVVESGTFAGSNPFQYLIIETITSRLISLSVKI